MLAIPSCPCKSEVRGMSSFLKACWNTHQMRLLSCADKTNLDGFEFWLTIFNYQAPCGWAPIPPIHDVIQVCVSGIPFRPAE